MSPADSSRRRLVPPPDDLRPWLWVGGWYALIWLLSQAPGTDTDSSAQLLDLVSLASFNGLARMLAHMTVFGLLALLIYRAVSRGRWLPRARWVAGTLALTALAAALDEIHQSFVPLRHGRPIDVVIDMIGAMLVLGGVLVLTKVRARRRLTAAGRDL